MITVAIDGDEVRARKHLQKWAVPDFCDLARVLVASGSGSSVALHEIRQAQTDLMDAKHRPLVKRDFDTLAYILRSIQDNWPKGEIGQ